MRDKNYSLLPKYSAVGFYLNFEYLILRLVRTSTSALIQTFVPMGQYALTLMEDIIAKLVSVERHT